MGSAETSEKELYVFSKRDEGESSRLNFQHRLAIKVSNGYLVHPSIPLSSLKAIADVGTGTGIWLEELHSQTAPETRLNGFDISAAQFPSESKCTYLLQNVLEPFPAEYHRLYDLVHIRYMVVAFKGEHYLQAIENLLQILKPGGYLQWDDFDYERIVTIGPPAPMHQELHDLTKRFFSGLGMSIHCSLNVLDGMKQAGLEKIVREERNSYWYETLAPDAQRWAWISFSGCVGKALMWSGNAKDEETATKIMDEKLEVLKKEYQSGVVPNFAQRVIVGRKPM